MASAVVSDNFETGSGAIPLLGGASVENRICSAWVNFNGTGTVAIRDSYNVSSVTDNGVGLYTVNYTSALPNIDYTMVGSAGTYGSTYWHAGVVAIDSFAATPSTVSTRVRVYNVGIGFYDSDRMYFTVFSN